MDGWEFDMGYWKGIRVLEDGFVEAEDVHLMGG